MSSTIDAAIGNPLPPEDGERLDGSDYRQLEEDHELAGGKDYVADEFQLGKRRSTSFRRLIEIGCLTLHNQSQKWRKMHLLAIEKGLHVYSGFKHPTFPSGPLLALSFE